MKMHMKLISALLILVLMMAALSGCRSKNEKTMSPEELKAKWQIGNYVTFGKYPQTSSGKYKTPIEWRILEQNGDEAILLSKYALDAKPYNKERHDTSWEKCTLRAWLNDDFYNKAFSSKEKKQIVKSDVSADRNPQYGTDPGNATQDKVYLLSINEANQYLPARSARECVPTDYALKNGAQISEDWHTSDGRNSCIWWLRTLGISKFIAVYVEVDGDVDAYGHGVEVAVFAARPVIRVKIF